MELWGAIPLDAMSHSRHFERSPYYESSSKEREILMKDSTRRLAGTTSFRKRGFISRPVPIFRLPRTTSRSARGQDFARRPTSCGYNVTTLSKESHWHRVMANIERNVDSLELMKLSEELGFEPKDLFAEEFSEQKDSVTALFRAEPKVATDKKLSQAISRWSGLCRQFTHLEKLVGADRGLVPPVRYDLPQPRNKWEAIHQGTAVADQERNRLKLGTGPVPELPEIVESQGVRVGLLPLDDSISGLFLTDENVGLTILVNSRHSEPEYVEQFGNGESACLAVTIHRHWAVATDETKDRRLSREIASNGIKLINTLGILLKAIRRGSLSVQAADLIKAELEENRFKMSFNASSVKPCLSKSSGAFSRTALSA
jgi:predicted nucleic acid-binding protein